MIAGDDRQPTVYTIPVGTRRQYGTAMKSDIGNHFEQTSPPHDAKKPVLKTRCEVEDEAGLAASLKDLCLR